MTAQGENILAFLDSAITQFEQRARALGGGQIKVRSYGSGVLSLEGAVYLADAGALHEDEVAWIALNDPASVLRRCAADRKLLQLHGDRCHSCPAKDTTGYLDEWTEYNYGQTCPVVRLIAEVYGWTQTSAPEPAQAPPSDGDQMT